MICTSKFYVFQFLCEIDLFVHEYFSMTQMKHCWETSGVCIQNKDNLKMSNIITAKKNMITSKKKSLFEH